MNPILALLGIVCGVIAITCLLRFLFQVAQVSPQNIVVLSVRRMSDPLLNPLRAVVPRSRIIDSASLLVCVVAMAARIWIQESHMDDLYVYTGVLSVIGEGWSYLWAGIVRILYFTYWIFFIAILVTVALSWIAPTSTSPYAQLAKELAFPILLPIQRLVPSLGGLDLSPMLALFILYVIYSRILPWLATLFN